MRIAHIVESMEIGGAEILVAQLCRMYRDKGHEVTTHCLVRSGPLATQLEQDGFLIVRHDSDGKLKTGRSLYRSFRDCRPDVVHCHNAFATTLGAPAARLAAVQAVISTRHGLVAPPHPLKQELLFWTAARFCDRIVGVCDATRRNLANARGSIPDRVITIRNCAAPAAGGMPAGVQKRGFTAVMVARLSPPKDHDGLLRAIAIARREVPDLRLWIIGDGVNAPALRQLASSLDLDGTVDFLGERHDVAGWLAAADVFVLASNSEGVPVSLLEAMAAGMPLIVTAVGGMEEIGRLSGAARLVPPGEPQALADALLWYAGRRAELPVIGARARQCYEQYFVPERMASDYLQLYQDCLKN